MSVLAGSSYVVAFEVEICDCSIHITLCVLRVIPNKLHAFNPDNCSGTLKTYLCFENYVYICEMKYVM